MPSYKDALRNEVIVSITNASRVILPGNMRRLALLISSVSVASLFVRFGQSVSINSGLLIAQNSTPVYLDEDMIGMAIKEDVFGILASGTGNLWILEILSP